VLKIQNFLHLFGNNFLNRVPVVSKQTTDGKRPSHQVYSFRLPENDENVATTCAAPTDDDIILKGSAEATAVIVFSKQGV
jgi:hypothetical protein